MKKWYRACVSKGARRSSLGVALGAFVILMLVACQPVAPPAPAAPAPAAQAATAVPAAAAPVAAPAAAGAACPQQGGTLTYGLDFNLDETLDPHITNWDTVIRIDLNVMEPLIWEPEPGKFVPALAESWDISPDGKEYTFHLKQGVKFHDGTPFNAQAVKFSLDRIMDPNFQAGQARDQLGPYDHTEVVDDYTAKVVMKQPYAALMTNLNAYAGIVSPAAVQKMGKEFAQHPVGTGPFMFKEWVPNDHVTLARNPDYNWGSSFFKNQGPACLDQIVFKIIPEPAVRMGTLKSGETQYINTIDLQDYDSLKNDPNFVVIEKPQPGVGNILQINMTSTGPVKDPAVRQALEYGIDRAGMNKAVFGGRYKVATSPLTAVTLGYDPKTADLYPYDPKKAADILDQAGWKLGPDGIRVKDGQKLTLRFPVFARDPDKPMAESIQANMKAIGVDVQTMVAERAAIYDMYKQNNYDIAFQLLTYGDPDALRTLFYSKNLNLNRSKINDPDIDKWLDEAVATTDRAKREQLYAQVQQKLLKDGVVVALLDPVTYYAKRAEVQGDYLDALADYNYLNDTWIKK